MELRLELDMNHNNTKLKKLMANVSKKKEPAVWPASVSPISQVVQDIENGNLHLLSHADTLHQINKRLDEIDKKLEMVQS